MSDKVIIAGIDLAWGERRPDGICLLESTAEFSRVRWLGLSHGDAALLALLDEHIGNGARLLIFNATLYPCLLRIHAATQQDAQHQ